MRWWGANLVIVVWLLVAAHQAGPFIPKQVRDWPWPTSAAHGLGIWQSRWELFAPEPDNKNQALEAIILFADGSQETWRTPDWRSLNNWQRFGLARQIKLYDSLWATWSSPVWPAFADHFAQQARAKRGTKQAVTRVELYAEFSPIPPAEGEWKSWTERIPVKERHLFYVKDYP